MPRVIKIFGVGVVVGTLLVPSFIAMAPTVTARAVSQIKNLVVPEVKLIFVGDLMFDRGVLGSVNKNFNGDFNQLFESASFLKEADLTFGNLEGPASDVGRNVGSIYSFRMKPESLVAAQVAGFDVLSVANNHAGDWTIDAFSDTIHRLGQLNILSPGGGSTYNQARTVQIREVKGLTVGFLGFTDVGPNWLAAGVASPGILLATDPNYAEIIATAAREVDILVVSIHFGEEYQVKSNDRQKYLSRLAIDSGAKIVVGHHPHVIQETETYKDGVIAYSLGNFIFDQSFSKETMEGGVLEIIIQDKAIKSSTLKKITLTPQYQPVPTW